MSELVTADEIWPRLAELSPQLRKHIAVHAQVYRGERWYLLHDQLNGQVLRLNGRAYDLVGRLDGKCTLNTIVSYLTKSESSDLTTIEVVNLIGRLQEMDALSNVLDKATAEQVKKYHENRRGMRLRKMLSPLLIRFPLLNPDSLLERYTPHFSFLFTGITAFIACLIMIVGGVLALDNLDLIAREFTSEVLKPANLILLWLLYPVMKLFHEFAHAIAVKYWGGDVHEMGITLLVLTPVPYVDASAASSFKSKRKRVLVSAAGILIELVLASLALMLWLNASDGWLRDCAFGVFTIGAISTVLFNANPLLKFDGYFVLQDLIEIPNLMSRSMQYYAYLVKRYVFKINNQISPVTAVGERRWLLAYGLLSSIYRLMVLFFIVTFLSGKYLLLGIALGVWAVIQQLVLPAIRGTKYILRSPEATHQRQRSAKILLGSVAAATLFFAVLPMPSATRAQGVVWVPQQGEIYAHADGFVSEVLVAPGDKVTDGQPLLVLKSPELERTAKVLENELQVLKIKSELMRSIDTAQFAVIKEDIAATERSLHDQQLQLQKLTVLANTSGTFTPGQDRSLIGNYFAQGDFIAHIVNPDQLVVRVAVPDSASGRLTSGVKSASVQLAESLGNSIKANVINEVPAADHKLPSAALGVAGGGGIPIASSDTQGLTTIDSVFHLQLGLPPETAIFGVGERAYVTLRHGAEPLLSRWVRSLKQVFLKTLPA